MNENLIKHLSAITDEERHLLSGGKLDLFTYSDKGSGLVDSGKLLSADKMIDIRPATRFTAFPRHCHNYVEIVYMCSGSQKHKIGGNTEITLKKGELLLLNQHAYHETDAAEESDIAVNFIIKPAFFDSVLDLIGSRNRLSEFIIAGLSGDGYEISYMHFDVSDVLPIQNLLENLIWSLINRPRNSRRTDQVTMALLFLNLLGHTDRLLDDDLKTGTDRIIVSALREIEENYPCATLSRVAAAHNVTSAYVSRTVKAVTGKTFKELLTEKRLSKAASLLRTSRLSVNDIIAAVGYENASYFYRIFTAKHGITPAEYRKLNKDI